LPDDEESRLAQRVGRASVLLDWAKDEYLTKWAVTKDDDDCIEELKALEDATAELTDEMSETLFLWRKKHM
jgi:hypothetical protein